VTTSNTHGHRLHALSRRCRRVLAGRGWNRPAPPRSSPRPCLSARLTIRRADVCTSAWTTDTVTSFHNVWPLSDSAVDVHQRLFPARFRTERQTTTTRTENKFRIYSSLPCDVQFSPPSYWMITSTLSTFLGKIVHRQMVAFTCHVVNRGRLQSRNDWTATHKIISEWPVVIISMRRFEVHMAVRPPLCGRDAGVPEVTWNESEQRYQAAITSEPDLSAPAPPTPWPPEARLCSH